VKQWLLETLVRHAPMGIAFVDLEFRFQLINDKLAAINGLPASAHLGRTIADVVPDLWPTVQPIFHKVRDTGQAVTDVEVSGEVASTPGFIRHWLEGFYPVHEPDGALIGIGVIAVELTEQKQAEANHRAVVAAMPDFIFDQRATAPTSVSTRRMSRRCSSAPNRSSAAASASCCPRPWPRSTTRRSSRR